MPEISQRVEHGPQLSETKFVIKRVGEGLQIDICRIHVPIKLRTRIISDVASCYCDRFDSVFAAGLCHVDRILGENDRIVVSERDRPAAQPLRSERDLLRRRHIGELVPFARFGDVPVLAKPAA